MYIKYRLVCALTAFFKSDSSDQFLSAHTTASDDSAWVIRVVAVLDTHWYACLLRWPHCYWVQDLSAKVRQLCCLLHQFQSEKCVCVLGYRVTGVSCEVARLLRQE
jgi:hypothetical protein